MNGLHYDRIITRTVKCVSKFNLFNLWKEGKKDLVNKSKKGL